MDLLRVEQVRGVPDLESPFRRGDAVQLTCNVHRPALAEARLQFFDFAAASATIIAGNRGEASNGGLVSPDGRTILTPGEIRRWTT